MLYCRPGSLIGTFDFKRRCTEWSVYDIKVPREPFESIGSEWVDNGIIFVKQLFNENGHLYTYVEFLQKV